MDAEARARLEEFVTTRTPALIRLAYLLTGDQHAAEDLLQSALLKAARRWKHIRNENPDAYVRAAMYHEQINWWRRRGRRSEMAVEHTPETPSPDPSSNTDLRLAMRQALLQLRPHHRAVVVLRYYEDMSEAQVAELLGCSIGTVRSRTHRAVTQLRVLLPEASLELDVPKVSR